MPTDLAISTTELSKTFELGFASHRRFEALRSASLMVKKGTSFGFLGPNGAGKTTTIKLITGLIFPTSGTVRVLGGAPTDARVRARMGCLAENPSFPDHLTGGEVLRFSCELMGIKSSQIAGEIDQVLGLVDLKHAQTLQTRKYSKGMVQRLGIAQALLNRPELIILDEPMSGLDPIGRRDIKDLIISLRRDGRTIFFSTHIIADVEEICDEIAMVNHGRIVKQGAVTDLVNVTSRETEIAASNLPADFPGAEPAAAGLTLLKVGEALVRETIERVWAAGGKVVSVRVSRFGLEELFMEEVRKERA